MPHLFTAGCSDKTGRWDCSLLGLADLATTLVYVNIPTREKNLVNIWFLIDSCLSFVESELETVLLSGFCTFLLPCSVRKLGMRSFIPWLYGTLYTLPSVIHLLAVLLFVIRFDVLQTLCIGSQNEINTLSSEVWFLSSQVNADPEDGQSKAACKEVPVGESQQSPSSRLTVHLPLSPRLDTAWGDCRSRGEHSNQDMHRLDTPLSVHGLLRHNSGRPSAVRPRTSGTKALWLAYWKADDKNLEMGQFLSEHGVDICLLNEKQL
jgi:hypothetical protein